MKYFDWTPPSEQGEFDILPLVLQAKGGDPEMFELPPDLIIEAVLTHPE